MGLSSLYFPFLLKGLLSNTFSLFNSFLGFIFSFKGILSAFGIGHADVVCESQEPFHTVFSDNVMASIRSLYPPPLSFAISYCSPDRLEAMGGDVTLKLSSKGFTLADIRLVYYVRLRYSYDSHSLSRTHTYTHKLNYARILTHLH